MPNKKYPGNGIFEFDQAKALSKIGLNVVYLAIDLRSLFKWRKWGFEKYNIENLTVYSVNIPIGRVPFIVYDILHLMILKSRFKRIEKQEKKKIELVHAHFLRLGYITALANKKWNIPFVFTEHSSDINKNDIEKRIFTRAKYTYKHCDKLIAVSPSLSKRIRESFEIESEYVPNILDIDNFKLGEKRTREGFRFISVGNLVYLKRMDLLIRAFDQAFGRNDQVTLTIVGDGPERDKLDALIQSKGLETRVLMKGSLTREEISDLFDDCDGFALVSQSETFGVAYIEALAKGLPVIGTRCGGPEVFINPQNGVLIDVDDEMQLIEALRTMHKSIDTYDRRAIANEIIHQFSPETVANKLKSLYEPLLKN